MKKYLLIHQDYNLEIDIRDFNTLKQLEKYVRLWQIETYTIALVYKEVSNE